jgi:hypothetical protein
MKSGWMLLIILFEWGIYFCWGGGGGFCFFFFFVLQDGTSRWYKEMVPDILFFFFGGLKHRAPLSFLLSFFVRLCVVLIETLLIEGFCYCKYCYTLE